MGANMSRGVRLGKMTQPKWRGTAVVFASFGIGGRGVWAVMRGAAANAARRWVARMAAGDRGW